MFRLISFSFLFKYHFNFIHIFMCMFLMLSVFRLSFKFILIHLQFTIQIYFCQMSLLEYSFSHFFLSDKALSQPFMISKPITRHLFATNNQSDICLAYLTRVAFKFCLNIVLFFPAYFLYKEQCQAGFRSHTSHKPNRSKFEFDSARVKY